MICKSNISAGNFVTGMNALALDVIRYSGGIIDWTKDELQDMDQKAMKIMTLNRCLHPRCSVARLHMKQEGGKVHISVEYCITAESRGLYLKECKEDMLSGALKENEEEETRRNSQKGKGMKERILCMKEIQEHCTQVVRKVDKEWVFEKRENACYLQLRSRH